MAGVKKTTGPKGRARPEARPHDPKAARIHGPVDEAELATALAYSLRIDAEVLNDPPAPQFELERASARDRIRRAWFAYHAPTDLVSVKRSAMINALNRAQSWEAEWERVGTVELSLRFTDKPRAFTLPREIIVAALASWPPRKGRPSRKKGSLNIETDWDRLNALFDAFGCGADTGESLRVQLSREGLYKAPSKKA